MKIGDSLYSFRIKIDFKKNEATFEDVGEAQILGINDKVVVVNDSNFSKYDLKKDNTYNSNPVIKQVRVNHFVLTSYYDEVNVRYTSPSQSIAIAREVMKKEAEKFLYEKFGRYCGKEILLNQI